MPQSVRRSTYSINYKTMYLEFTSRTCFSQYTKEKKQMRLRNVYLSIYWKTDDQVHYYCQN